MTESAGAVLARQRWRKRAPERVRARAEFIITHWPDVPEDDRAQIRAQLEPILRDGAE